MSADTLDPAIPAHKRASLWRSALVTIAAAMVVLIVPLLGTPGLPADFYAATGTGGQLSLYALFNLSRGSLHLFAVGLLPLIGAFQLVEIACALVPRWRPLRFNGFDGRRKLMRPILVLALGLSLVQAYGLTVRNAFAEADLPLLVRSWRYHVLYLLFGPYAASTLVVPATRLADAQALLDRLGFHGGERKALDPSVFD